MNISIVCPNGKYSLPGSDDEGDCNCPVNAVSQQKASQVAQCVCSKGHYRVYNPNALLGGWHCVQCQPGEYCYDNLNASCPPHSISLAVAESLLDCFCTAGYTNSSAPSPQELCIDCPADHYCTGKGEKSRCVTHAISPTQSRDATKCYCDKGWKGRNNDECVACGTPTFCYEGIEAQCSEGTFSNPLSWTTSNCSCIAGRWGPTGMRVQQSDREGSYTDISIDAQAAPASCAARGSTTCYQGVWRATHRWTQTVQSAPLAARPTPSAGTPRVIHAQGGHTRSPQNRQGPPCAAYVPMAPLHWKSLGNAPRARSGGGRWRVPASARPAPETPTWTLAGRAQQTRACPVLRGPYPPKQGIQTRRAAHAPLGHTRWTGSAYRAWQAHIPGQGLLAAPRVSQAHTRKGTHQRVWPAARGRTVQATTAQHALPAVLDPLHPQEGPVRARSAPLDTRP